MLHESTRRLIAKLCEMTERGEIAWREAPGASGARSRFETEGYAVEVQAEPPLVAILRADGRELERADADDLQVTATDGGGESYVDRVREMARRADRIARGAEQAIATILSALSAPPAPKAETVEPALETPASPAPAAAPAAQTPVISLTRTPTAERFGASFGAINAFSQKAPSAAPQGLLRTGISAVSRQTPEVLPARPAPPPASADAYKPWD